MASFSSVYFFHFKKLIFGTEKNSLKWQVLFLIQKLKMFEIELERNENKNEKLPIELFQELETTTRFIFT